jgi:hypothetical protein
MKRLNRAPFTPISKLTNSLLDRLKCNETSLKYLTFSSRDLGSQGVRVLSEALCDNSSLEVLDLSCNRVDATGCLHIALLLSHQNMNLYSGGIKNLILGDNDIRDDGVMSIANALENNQIVESLWIDNNCIGSSGLDMLAQSLIKNDTLERLHLKHNSFQSLTPLLRCTFNKESLDAIADSNHTLKHIFLNCGYSYECDELESILKINRMGKIKARRIKLAIYLQTNMSRLLGLDIDVKLLPSVFEMLGETKNLSTMFSAVKDLSSMALMFRDDVSVEVKDNRMDIEYTL